MSEHAFFRVAVAGAAGAVGKQIWRLPAERSFPLSGLKLLSSSRSVGTIIKFKGE